MITIYEKQNLVHQIHAQLKAARKPKDPPPHLDFNKVNQLIDKVRRNMVFTLEAYYAYRRTNFQFTEYLKKKGKFKELDHISRNSDSDLDFKSNSMDKQFTQPFIDDQRVPYLVPFNYHKYDASDSSEESDSDISMNQAANLEAVLLSQYQRGAMFRNIAARHEEESRQKVQKMHEQKIKEGIPPEVEADMNKRKQEKMHLRIQERQSAEVV